MADNSFDSTSSNPLFCSETDVFSSQTSNQNLGSMNESQSLIESLLESEESFCVMYERENLHLPRNDYFSRLKTGVLDLGIRTEAMEWIFKAHSHYSFGPLSFCLSINYLDRFLSVFELPRGKSWAVQLLAVTCLSIAIKIVETSVILTVDLQVCGPKFVFEGKTLQRMELLVLSTLNWKMQAYTPFSFIDFFQRKTIDNVHLSSMALVSRSIQLILSTIKVIDFLEFRPSEIAAAVAISVSTGAELDITKAVSSFNHLGKDRVLKCLKLIKDLNLIVGPNNCTSAVAGGGATSSFPQSPSGVLDTSSYMSYITNKTHDSSHTSSTKRRKVDTLSSQQDDFKS